MVEVMAKEPCMAYHGVRRGRTSFEHFAAAVASLSIGLVRPGIFYGMAQKYNPLRLWLISGLTVFNGFLEFGRYTFRCGRLVSSRLVSFDEVNDAGPCTPWRPTFVNGQPTTQQQSAFTRTWGLSS